MATFEQAHALACAAGDLYKAALDHPEFGLSREQRAIRPVTKRQLNRWKKGLELAAKHYSLCVRVCEMANGTGEFSRDARRKRRAA